METVHRKQNRGTIPEIQRKKKTVKNLITKAKKANWIKFGKRLERNTKENQKLYYRIIRNINKEKQANQQALYSKDGKLLTDSREIIES